MAQSDSLFTGAGWAVAAQSDFVGAALLPPEAFSAAQQQSTDEEEDESAPSSPVAAGGGPPADLVAAFLQSHNAAAAAAQHSDGAHQQQQQQHQQAVRNAAAASNTAAALRSSSINSDADGDALLLPNPFALHEHQQHQQQHPNFQQLQQVQQQDSKAAGGSQQHQHQRAQRKRTFLQRLLRGLMITGASAGLMALGAWGGSLAYRHYMAQLDDRDQLARRVADLQKQEEKLVLRCTALEQDRQSLAKQLSDASSALADGAAARTRLQQQLGQAHGDREEAVRLNLNLQRKLSSLEEQHASLSAAHKDKLHALDITLAEAARLDREVGKLTGTVDKLESRCGALEAANVELKKEHAAAAALSAAAAAAAAAAAQHKNKAAKC